METVDVAPQETRRTKVKGEEEEGGGGCRKVTEAAPRQQNKKSRVMATVLTRRGASVPEKRKATMERRHRYRQCQERQAEAGETRSEDGAW